MTNEKSNRLPVIISLLSLLVAASSVTVSSFIYFNARAVREEARAVSEEAARDASLKRQLHLSGKPNASGVELSPTNSAVSLGMISITLPADMKLEGWSLLPGEHSIDLKPTEQVLSARTFRNNPKGSEATLEFLPIIISAEYFIEGRRLSSHALYQLFYVDQTSPPSIAPVSLRYCGELAPESLPIDFLIDPRVETTFGYSDKPSTSVFFDCDTEGESFTYVKLPDKGKVVVTTPLTNFKSPDLKPLK